MNKLKNLLRDHAPVSARKYRELQDLYWDEVSVNATLQNEIE